jgi:death-on-curing protein
MVGLKELGTKVVLWLLWTSCRMTRIIRILPVKLTYLVFKFCAGHYFNDGNKRIAITLGAYFLHKNEYFWQACTFMRQLESIVYHVAASNIDQDLLYRIIDCFMNKRDYDEELKIDIAKAMNKGALGIAEDGE